MGVRRTDRRRQIKVQSWSKSGVLDLGLAVESSLFLN
jgi:hypothetical protein